MTIRFGTSGWREIIGREFTFENVERVTNAICIVANANLSTDKKLIIGHDSRFMGERFAEVAAAIATKHGFEVLLCSEPVPTPTISHAIRDQKAAGALNFTASHNPPEYQGIKFSTSDGAPALPELTKQVEELLDSGSTPNGTQTAEVIHFDPRSAYLEDLTRKVKFDVIANAGGRYAYDPLWGAGRGYLDRILRDHGSAIETLHDWRDVTFGGRSPEPGETQLAELKEKVLKEGLTLGLVTDGDADRFGVIDSNGELISPNELIAILTDYLVESRGWRDGVARSVATSHLIDRIAKKHGLELYETPVGFKYIGELINKDAIVLGGEESAGLSIKGHFPEKDGIIACLLAAEAVAARGASLTEQLKALTDDVGKPRSGRVGVKLDQQIATRLKDRLAEEPSEIGGRRIKSINRMDGVKFFFEDDSWVLMRPSGTEPVVRIYAESESQSDLEVLLEQGRNYILG